MKMRPLFDEPTIVKNWYELNDCIIENYPNSKQKVLSNSVVFLKKSKIWLIMVKYRNEY